MDDILFCPNGHPQPANGIKNVSVVYTFNDNSKDEIDDLCPGCVNDFIERCTAEWHAATERVKKSF